MTHEDMHHAPFTDELPSNDQLPDFLNIDHEPSVSLADLEQDLGHVAVKPTEDQVVATELDPVSAGYLDKMVNTYYNNFSSSVAHLLYDDDAHMHIIGHGMEGTVYLLEEGVEKYAVKHGGVDDSVVESFRRGAPIKKVAHLVAADPDEAIAVMKLMPAGRVDKQHMEAKAADVTNEQISELINTALELHQAGLCIDNDETSNIMYDKDWGFGIIDYHMTRQPISDKDSAKAIMSLASALTTSGSDPDVPQQGNEGYAAYMLNQERLKVGLLNRYLDVMEAEHSDIISIAAQVQQVENQKTDTDRSGMIYDIYTLPHGEPFDSFAERVRKLGLEGRAPEAWLAPAIEQERLLFS